MSHTFISTTFLSSSRQIVRHPTGCQIRPLCPPTSATGVGEAVHVNRSIFSFENAERICHTGIVYKVDSTTVYTIEGNTSAGEQVVPNGGAVCKKSYKLYNSRIAGFGRPDYSSVSDSDPDPEPVKRVWAKAQLPMIRKGMSGDAVMVWQIITGTEPDGDFGPKTLNATVDFQTAHKLDGDGIVGQKTWAAGLAELQ